MFDSITKNKKVIEFITSGSRFFTTINLKNLSDSIPYNISDSILPNSYVYHILENFKQNIELIEPYKPSGDSITIETAGTKRKKEAIFGVYFTKKIGDIQPVIFDFESFPILFNNVRFGTLTYLFFRPLGGSKVAVFGTSISYN